jgi:hypothetical protein
MVADSNRYYDSAANEADAFLATYPDAALFLAAGERVLMS